MELQPELRAAFEAESGIKVDEIDPEEVKLFVERSKAAGNEAFQRKRYAQAVELYCQAIAGDARDKALFSNRAASYLAMGRYDDGLADAAKCIELDADWSKGYYRLGCALLLLQRWSEASRAFSAGVELSPDSQDMRAKLAVAKEQDARLIAARRAEQAMQQRHIVSELRRARLEDNREMVLNQWRQTMSGPEWEAADYEWRPTFLPSMRLRSLNRELFESDPKRRAVLGYVAAIAVLDRPKRALPALQDLPRLRAYQTAIVKALANAEVRPHVLVVSAGGGCCH